VLADWPESAPACNLLLPHFQGSTCSWFAAKP
jgi:hypothetical protein